MNHREKNQELDNIDHNRRFRFERLVTGRTLHQAN